MSLRILSALVASIGATIGLTNHQTFRREYSSPSYGDSPHYFRTKRGGQMQAHGCKKPRNRKAR